MKIKHAGWAVAVAAVLSAPAVFAQTAVISASGPVVTSGTGVIVTPGVSSTNVVVVPGTQPAMPPARYYGGVMAQADSTTVVAGNTTTTTTRYWANVPPDVTRDGNFQRWRALP
jgi:hypothetical protein